MFRSLCVVMLVLASAGIAFAQDEPRPEMLKKMYGDALVQLKAAQARKNELADENEKLAARAAELQKQVAELRSQAESLTEKTFFLRSHYAAWQDFVRQYPGIMARWKIYMETGWSDTPQETGHLIDRDWPLSTANK